MIERTRMTAGGNQIESKPEAKNPARPPAAGSAGTPGDPLFPGLIPGRTRARAGGGNTLGNGGPFPLMELPGIGAKAREIGRKRPGNGPTCAGMRPGVRELAGRPDRPKGRAGNADAGSCLIIGDGSAWA